MNITHMRETVSKFGFRATAQHIVYRAANKVTEVTILKGVTLTMQTVDPKFLQDDAGCTWGFVDGPALHAALARGEALMMDAAFIDEALARGDRCYAAIEHGEIISYGWYSARPTPVTAISDDVILHFDSSHAYMYRGYTLPEHRGRRLHGIGMARALKAHVDEGYRGLVSIVDSSNFPSLSSCYRLGYRDCGQLFYAKIAGHHLTYATRGCEPHGLLLKVEKRPA